MNDTAAQRLALVLQLNGTSLLKDRNSLLRLLAPGAAEPPDEIKTLLLMVDTHAVAHLLKWARAVGQNRPTYIQMRDHMVSKYVQSGKLSVEDATWALDAWMMAISEVKRAAEYDGQPATLALEPMAPPPSAPPTPAAAPASSPLATQSAARTEQSSAARNPYAPPQAPVADIPEYVASEPFHFIQNGQSLAAGRGLDWIKEGWRLFAAHPLTWWVCLILVFVCAILIQIIPFIGQVISTFVNPILFAGLMIGAHAVAQGDDLRVNHVFSGFKVSVISLLLLTFVIVAWGLAIVGIIFLLFGGSLTAASDARSMIPAIGGIVIVGLILIFPLIAASYFANALVAVGGLGPLAALRSSFWGCMKNMLPFLVYGILFIVAAIIATIPFGLGWLVLFPIWFTSTYAAYRDIFYGDQAVGAPAR